MFWCDRGESFDEKFGGEIHDWRVVCLKELSAAVTQATRGCSWCFKAFSAPLKQSLQLKDFPKIVKRQMRRVNRKRVYGDPVGRKWKSFSFFRSASGYLRRQFASLIHLIEPTRLKSEEAEKLDTSSTLYFRLTSEKLKEFQVRTAATNKSSNSSRFRCCCELFYFNFVTLL